MGLRPALQLACSTRCNDRSAQTIWCGPLHIAGTHSEQMRAPLLRSRFIFCGGGQGAFGMTMHELVNFRDAGIVHFGNWATP